MQDTSVERYLRMKTSTGPLAVQWCRGYEEGYATARELQLNTGDNSAGPQRLLARLRNELEDLALDDGRLASEVLCSELRTIAACIEHCTDDTVAWLEDAAA